MKQKYWEPAIERFGLRSYALWGLCLLALIAVGCGDDGVPETAEDDINYAPVQESRIPESLDSELRSDSPESDDEEDLASHQEGGDSGSTEEEVDSAVEELEQHQEGGDSGSTEEVVDSAVEELEQHQEGGDSGSTEEEVDSAVEELEQQTESASELQEEPPTLGSAEQQVGDSPADPNAWWLYAQKFFGLPGRLALDDRTKNNTVRLVVDSITLDDCVMRGEIRNHSDDLYARNVTVTIAPLNGEKNVTWHWPLTMEPGESAPFELEVAWPPHYHDPLLENSDYIALQLFGNTIIDIAVELSPNPDVRRAFVIDYDDTEPYNIFMEGPNSHSFPVYDERALELQSSNNFLWTGQAYSPTSRAKFAEIFPDELVTSNEVEPIVAGFVPYDHTDIYYVPSVLYPDIYKVGDDDIVSDVRVYQAYKEGSRVVDVWKLVPHSVLEQVDAQGFVTDRKFIPVNDITQYSSLSSESVHIRLLHSGGLNGRAIDDKFYNFPERNVDGWDSKHRDGVGFVIIPYQQKYDELWIGGVSHSEVTSTIDPLATLPNSNDKSCNTLGGLSNSFHYFSSQIREKAYFTLGYNGIFSGFQSDSNAAQDIYINLDTVRISADMIRGLLHNKSDRNFARDVTVSASHRDTGVELGTWQWPLSVQPGERAPFEIPYSESGLSVGQIKFQVSATLSEHADITRSFQISIYSSGTVAGEDSIDLLGSRFPSYYEVMPGYYLNHNAIWRPPYSRYTKEEFLDLYDGIVSLDQMEKLELFTFLDMYARLTPPNSHPELARTVTTQFIHDLRAYAAILDDDWKVVDVIELPIFTPIYGQANVGQSNVEVNTIPAPNRWSPNAVRLLRIIPYEDEADMNEGYYSQVWIGGASEPLR